jgi:hypothetical protein
MNTLLVDLVFASFVAVPALALIAMRVVRIEKSRQPAPDLSARGRRLLRS